MMEKQTLFNVTNSENDTDDSTAETDLAENKEEETQVEDEGEIKDETYWMVHGTRICNKT